jgi:hypothetical protein
MRASASAICSRVVDITAIAASAPTIITRCMASPLQQYIDYIASHLRYSMNRVEFIGLWVLTRCRCRGGRGAPAIRRMQNFPHGFRRL